MKRYVVYLSEHSYKPEHRPARVVGAEAVGFKTVVLADSRRAAFLKALPRLRPELPKLAGLYASVFVGEKHSRSWSAGRMTPFQMVVSTGQPR